MLTHDQTAYLTEFILKWPLPPGIHLDVIPEPIAPHADCVLVFLNDGLRTSGPIVFREYVSERAVHARLTQAALELLTVETRSKADAVRKVLGMEVADA